MLDIYNSHHSAHCSYVSTYVGIYLVFMIEKTKNIMHDKGTNVLQDILIKKIVYLIISK